MARVGLVLAGGQSRRLQQQAGQPHIDKGLLTLGGKPLVKWAIEHMQAHVDQIYISANNNLAAFSIYAPVITDVAAYAQQGPLAGIVSLLQNVQQVSSLTVLPVDVPFLPLNLIPSWAVAASESPSLPRAAFAASVQRDHPLCLFLADNVLANLEGYLASNGRRVQAWLKTVNARRVVFDENPNDFFNINTADDFLVAQTRCHQVG